MIIVSQDKRKIINFDNINMILIRENEILSFDNTYTDSQGGDLLATYKTEERAKEVLQKIISTYRSANYEVRSCHIGYVANEVYEMPEK